MKKLMFLFFCVACLGSCKQTYDNIADFVTEETIYPGRFDTIIGRIGLERVELDLLKAGRLPASQIKLGKAKNTVVEYDGKTLVWDSVCSWVNVTGLTQPKMYRFTVYTTDEYDNKSVPQEIALKPYFSSDFEYLLMASPRISASPWAFELKWPQPSSVLLEYVNLTYKYTDKDDHEITGECEKNPVIQMGNLDPGHEYSIEIRYTVVPKADNEVILDTTFLVNTYQLNTPTAEAYQKNLASREVNTNSYSWANGSLTINWKAVADEFMQYTTVRYFENNVEKEITVPNNDNATILPGFKLGTTLQIKSNYEVVGLAGTYIDSFDKEFDPFIDIDRTAWRCIYTSVAPATDGYPGTTFPAGDWTPEEVSEIRASAHINGSAPATFLSMAKPTKSVNGSVNNGAYQMPMIFILDMQAGYRFNYLRMNGRIPPDNGQGLKVWAMQVSGSNNYQGPMNKYENPTADSATEDATSWANVGGVVQFARPIPDVTPNMMIPLSNYRYVKIEYKEFDMANNSACQMSEFYLGITSSMYAD